jgi:hypothetical protein
MAGTLAGGLRDRMLAESIREQIVAHLDSLGWFDSNRYHSPLIIVSAFPDDTAEVELNTVAFSMDDADGRDLEMGSLAEEHLSVLFVDMFMEDDSVGWHLSGDVYAYLKKNRLLEVYDYENAKLLDFTVEIERVNRSRPTRVTQAWQKYWHIVSFAAVDMRTNA